MPSRHEWVVSINILTAIGLGDFNYPVQSNLAQLNEPSSASDRRIEARPT